MHETFCELVKHLRWCTFELKKFSKFLSHKKSEDAWCILAFFWLRGQIVECSSDIRQFWSSRMSNCRKFLSSRQFRSNLVSNCRIHLTSSPALAPSLCIITPASYLTLDFNYWHWVRHCAFLTMRCPQSQKNPLRSEEPLHQITHPDYGARSYFLQLYN